MKNKSIRTALFQYNMKQWQLAELLQVSEYTLCRKLRHELPEDKQKEIVTRIQEWSKNHER